MALGIYKKGQGYWTRMMSGIALGLIAGMGGVWMWDLLKIVRIGEMEPVYTSATGAVIFLAVFGVLGYHFIGRHKRVVDFMIATEGEVKKVNWSNRREILGSTWVVIGLTIFIALLCFAFDWFFATIFRWMEVLDA